MESRKYSDLFIDFDDTLYDTHGNADIALLELYDHFRLDRYFQSPSQFTEPYWLANMLLWSQYARGEVTRDYLIVERFRRPLSVGMGEGVTEAFCLEVSDWFLEACADKPGLVEGAREATDYLRRRGYRLHITSNGFHEVQYRKLHACGLFSHFDTIVLSEDAGVNKPSQAFFDYAFRTTGATPGATLMIGDNFVTDIQGAQAAGLDVVFFNRHPDQFQAPAPVNYEIHHLKELLTIL